MYRIYDEKLPSANTIIFTPQKNSTLYDSGKVYYTER